MTISRTIELATGLSMTLGIRLPKPAPAEEKPKPEAK